MVRLCNLCGARIGGLLGRGHDRSDVGDWAGVLAYLVAGVWRIACGSIS
jgi:hypothetical protein